MAPETSWPGCLTGWSIALFWRDSNESLQLGGLTIALFKYVSCLAVLRRLWFSTTPLQALPITQHARIWEPYSAWVKTVGVWETAVRVFRRYLRFDENRREEYVDYLLSIGHHDEAANQLAIIANDDDWKSKAGRSRHQVRGKT